MENIPVIIDVDTGIDDAYALIIAVASGRLDVKAVTTVAGNVTLSHTTENTCNMLHLLGVTDVPVSPGASAPLSRELLTAPEVHGADGLRGYRFSGSHDELISPVPAVERMAQILKESDRPVTILALGPATNVAQLLLRYPGLKGNIERILFMGTSYRCGNPTIVSTFNVLVDPEAFEVLLDSGVPLYALPLDTSNRGAYLTKEECLLIRDIPGEVARLAYDTLCGYGDRVGQKGGCFAETQADEKDWQQAGHAHLPDPAVVAFLLHPEWFTVKKYYCQVECEGKLTTGFTIIDMDDYYGKTEAERNLWYIDSMQREPFVRLFLDSLRHFAGKQ